MSHHDKQGEVNTCCTEAEPQDRRKIEKSLALWVPPATKQQLRQQRLQNLQQNLALGRRNVQAIKR